MIKSKSKKKQLVVLNQSIPPSILINPTCDVVFRFVKQNAATSNIQGKDFGSMLVYSISSTVAYPLYESIRVLKITAYGPASVLTSATGYTNTMVSLRQVNALAMVPSQPGGIGSSERSVQGYPTGGQGAYCSFKFRDPNNLWFEPNQLANGTTVFQVTGPIGTIVDVHCVIRVQNTTGSLTALASTGATLGQIYYNYLDAANTQFLQSVANNNGKVWA